MSFVTSRSEEVRNATRLNLERAGFSEFEELVLKPDNWEGSSAEYKRAQFAEFEQDGWTIVLKLGDQLSDLDDPIEVADVLVPNPFYTTHRRAKE